MRIERGRDHSEFGQEALGMAGPVVIRITFIDMLSATSSILRHTPRWLR